MLFWTRKAVAVGPEGGYLRRLGRIRRPINFTQGGLGFLLLPLEAEGIEEVVTSAGTKEVRIALFHASGEPQVSSEHSAEHEEIAG